MKRLLCVVLCILLAVAVVGCSGGDSVKGTWKASDEYVQAERSAYSDAFGAEPDEAAIDMIKNTTIVFDGNGKFTGTGQMSPSGTYKIDGETLTLDNGATFILKDNALYIENNPYGDIPVFVKD